MLMMPFSIFSCHYYFKMPFSDTLLYLRFHDAMIACHMLLLPLRRYVTLYAIVFIHFCLFSSRYASPLITIAATLTLRCHDDCRFRFATMPILIITLR